ncbi:hypothetical protein FV218_07070 [Methylobacterium sp. WL69]|uniref:hypothetical protein n=1 Tax=Methylobacterium sp. WL69 TaxID=2603893 RepID=UPI0011C7D426|nr:hypothetical protein [Methylobacterium sp. WL69]TXM76515.1 hypothetical protein FV218_07070 [Methylobacterium sp. WL69]
MTDNPSTHRQVAVVIADAASPEERGALMIWAQGLLDVRASSAPPLQKARQALALTARSQIIWPAVKLIGREVKRLAWDQRSTTARLGLGGAAIGAMFFGGQSAGIAALGTAVGVPLWVVFGAGASFLNVLREELARKGDR